MSVENLQDIIIIIIIQFQERLSAFDDCLQLSIYFVIGKYENVRLNCYPFLSAGIWVVTTTISYLSNLKNKV
jgi:hypothetical protein